MRAYAVFILLCLLLPWALSVGASPCRAEEKLKDGFYAVLRISEARESLLPLAGNEALVKVSPLFLEGGTEFVVLQREPFAPLALKEKPVKIKDPTGRTQSWLLLTLTAEAGGKLEELTKAHVGGRGTLVIGGEAVTVHKIREVIKGGRLQVSRCSDTACEYLYEELKDNVQGPSPGK